MKHHALKLPFGLRMLFLGAVLGATVPEGFSADAGSASVGYLSPTALAANQTGGKLYAACATANQVLVLETARGAALAAIPLGGPPSGLALSPDGSTLYVTSAEPNGRVWVVDTAGAKVVASIPAGHTVMSPVLSPDGQTLYVCCRFNNEVVFIDVAERAVRKRVPVAREPIAAAVTPDGRFLLAAHHIHAGPSDADYVASSVSVIDIEAGKVQQTLKLPNGSGMLRDVRVSLDGKFACVTHLVARFHLPTTQIERGWINSNALTLIDLASMTVINTVLLDNVDRGAANPWAVAWSADSQRIFVSHAGTHEISMIDWPALQAKLVKVAGNTSKPSRDYVATSLVPADVPNDLAFLVGVRQRIKLLETDRGPRALALAGGELWVANYFTDNLTRIDLAGEKPRLQSVALGEVKPMTQIRRGEHLFNDGMICFQGWQSCASCHSSDARVDGMNWDNLNDGIGNPKNVKSLLLAHQTPPSMAMGVREDAEYAVRAGIRHTLFTVQPEEDCVALDEYLKALQPIPSPWLVDGGLSPAAERGKALFFDSKVGCAQCHRPPLYTNLKSYDAGTVGRFDKPTDRFDTPSLIEAWRTEPYLHDGRAVTIEEAITHWNREDKRGRTSHLTPEEIAELAAFVRSL
jgi:YVTN family beta-propeller protein